MRGATVQANPAPLTVALEDYHVGGSGHRVSSTAHVLG